VADAPEAKQLKEQVTAQISNDMMGQYLLELQNQVGVSINQTAVQQILGQPSGS
jgi:hypothetical protein